MSTAEITKQTSLGFDSAGLHMMPEEFDAIEDWDELYRCELIRGVFIVSPYPSPPHGGMNEFLGNLLFHYVNQHPGHTLDGTITEVYLPTGPETRRCPDRCIWCGLGRQPKPSKDIPAIVIEIISPGKQAWERDYREKRDEYLNIGVKEYWVIDRFRRQLTAYRAKDESVADSVIDEAGAYTTDLLPGFTLKLADLLAAGDRWEETE